MNVEEKARDLADEMMFAPKWKRPEVLEAALREAQRDGVQQTISFLAERYRVEPDQVDPVDARNIHRHDMANRISEDVGSLDSVDVLEQEREGS